MPEPDNGVSQYLNSFIYNGSNPNINQELRQRIALAMLTQKRAAPKNAGEGITAIGEALGENRLRNQLEASDLGAQKDVLSTRAPAGASAEPVVQRSALPPAEDREVASAASPVVVRPPIPAPDGTPGNRGDTVFPTAANGLVQPQQPSPPATRSVVAPPVLPPAETAPSAFSDRFNAARPGGGPQAAMTPPPGTPVLAAGNEPDAQEMSAGRAALAQALMQQQAARGGPLPNPTRGAVTPPASQPLPLPVGGPPADTGIRAAPPLAEQPGAVVGWVPGAPGRVPGADIIGPSPRENQLTHFLTARQGNPYWARSPEAAELKQLQDVRAIRQKEAEKDREVQQLRGTEQFKSHIAGRMDQAKRIVDVQKDQEAVIEARNRNQLRAQFANMDPDTVFKTMTESSKVASSAAKSLAASQSAIQALNAGAITGAGAEARLDIAKFFHNMGLPDKGNVIANTETFRGAMQPVVASIMHQTSGTSQLSEGELRFAARAAAGDITLDAQSVRMLTTIIDKASRGVIADHQKKMDVLFPDNPQARALFGVEAPKPSAPSAGTPDGTTATGPNGARMIRRNGRWEPM